MFVSVRIFFLEKYLFVGVDSSNDCLNIAKWHEIQYFKDFTCEIESYMYCMAHQDFHPKITPNDFHSGHVTKIIFTNTKREEEEEEKEENNSENIN